MDNSTPDSEKRLVMVIKSGPAFRLDDVAQAHIQLDMAGIPQDVNGRPMSLSARIAYMRGMLDAARMGAEYKRVRR